MTVNLTTTLRSDSFTPDQTLRSSVEEGEINPDHERTTLRYSISKISSLADVIVAGINLCCIQICTIQGEIIDFFRSR